MTERENQSRSFSQEGRCRSHSHELQALISLLEKKGLLSRAEILEEIEAFRVK